MADHKATPEEWAELRARVEQLEGKYDTQRLATLEWGNDVETHARLIDKLWMRVDALEANAQGTSNDRQIRSSLVERVASAIHPSRCADPSLYLHEARAAIREVAAWLRRNERDDLAYWLEQEAER
jgi:hypothetical protein